MLLGQNRGAPPSLFLSPPPPLSFPLLPPPSFWRTRVCVLLPRRGLVLLEPRPRAVAGAADRARRLHRLPHSASARVVSHPACRVSRERDLVQAGLGRLLRGLRIQRRGAGPRGRRDPALPDQDRGAGVLVLGGRRRLLGRVHLRPHD